MDLTKPMKPCSIADNDRGMGGGGGGGVGRGGGGGKRGVKIPWLGYLDPHLSLHLENLK